MSACKSCKILKGILWTVAGVLALVLVAILALPLWIGPVVTGIANSQVPKITKTGFNMGEFGLNPYTGRLHVGDVQLQNPERFFTSSREEAKEGEGILDAAKRHAGNAVAAVGDAVTSSETNAVSFTAIDVNLAMTSLASDTIRIEEIAIRDLSIYGDLTFANIREIASNAAGDKEAEAGKPEDTAPEADGAAAAPEGGKKVVVDRIFITGTRFQWGHVSIPLPDIELKDVGKEEPVDEDGLFDTIVNAICDAADKTKSGLGTAFKAALNAGKAVGAVVGEGIDALGKGAGAAADVVGDAGKAVSEGAGKAAGAAADAVGNAGKAVSDGAGAAVDAVKGLFK